MKRVEDSLAPLGDVFQEAWHAQTLAAAHGLAQSGAFTKTAWAEELGAALKRAEERGAPDTEETYYLAALEALEALAPLSQTELEARKEAWKDAYRRTAHGDPVTL